MIRLQKYIAMCGVASRRKAEQIIMEGRVTINGRRVTELGTKVDERSDIVAIDKKRIEVELEKKYYMLHKPRGYVTTSEDEQGRKKVVDLLPDKYRVYPVGRLDQGTSGMLLLTNDGDFAYKLTHPKHEITKTYRARVDKILEETALNKLRRGTDIGEFSISPCKIQLVNVIDGKGIYEISIHEGKNRQVRKMIEFAGGNVLSLRRTAIGKLRLGKLEVGRYRELTKEEISYLMK